MNGHNCLSDQIYKILVNEMTPMKLSDILRKAGLKVTEGRKVSDVLLILKNNNKVKVCSEPGSEVPFYLAVKTETEEPGSPIYGVVTGERENDDDDTLLKQQYLKQQQQQQQFKQQQLKQEHSLTMYNSLFNISEKCQQMCPLDELLSCTGQNESFFNIRSFNSNLIDSNLARVVDNKQIFQGIWCALRKVSPKMTSARDLSLCLQVPAKKITYVLKKLNNNGIIKVLRTSHGNFYYCEC